MDQQQYLDTDFQPQDFIQLIKKKHAAANELKGQQLDLRGEREKLKSRCDELASKIIQ